MRVVDAETRYLQIEGTVDNIVVYSFTVQFHDIILERVVPP